MRLKPLPEVLFGRTETSPARNKRVISVATPGDVGFIARRDGKPVMAGRYKLAKRIEICHAITVAPKFDSEQADLGEDCPTNPKALPKVLFYRTTRNRETGDHGWCVSDDPADLAYMDESVSAGRYELVEVVTIGHDITVSSD